MRRPALWILAVSLFATSTVTATPIGDDYFFSGTNFPVSFPANNALIFNNTGDFTPELVPGSGIAGGMSVVEQFAGLTPSSAEILRFAFFFDQSPADLDAEFGFTISGLEWGDGRKGLLEAAGINVLFGTGSTGTQNVTLLTSGSVDANGFSITFATPSGRSWNDIFGDNTPSSLTVDFKAAVERVPEPSTMVLLGLGLVAAFGTARSRRQR